MVELFDVRSNVGISAFEYFIKSRSYVDGFAPSQADVSMLVRFAEGAVTKEAFPHTSRWMSHITSFTDEERKAWVGTFEEFVAPVKVVYKSDTESEASSDDDDSDSDSDDDSVQLEDDDSDDEDAKAILAEKERITQAKIAEGKDKAKNAKSSIIFDIKPWGEETDMKLLEKRVREIEMEGLRWAGGELKEVAFGIFKLQINAVVFDDLVMVDDLEDKIRDIDELVQSIDIFAFNKL